MDECYTAILNNIHVEWAILYGKCLGLRLNEKATLSIVLSQFTLKLRTEKRLEGSTSMRLQVIFLLCFQNSYNELILLL